MIAVMTSLRTGSSARTTGDVTTLRVHGIFTDNLGDGSTSGTVNGQRSTSVVEFYDLGSDITIEPPK